MSNLLPAISTDPNALPLADDRARQFLQEHPIISQSLLADCEYDLDKVSTLVEPILNAPDRCAISYYVQAATTGRTAFLTTNLIDPQAPTVTASAGTWLVGRNRNCALTIADPSISRCHAVIGHHPVQGFYVMDVGSSNGTFLNHKRLGVLQRQKLQDGDLLRFSHLQVEFFLISQTHLSTPSAAKTILPDRS